AEAAAFNVVQEISVRKHSALWRACCPRGVNQYGEIGFLAIGIFQQLGLKPQAARGMGEGREDVLHVHQLEGGAFCLERLKMRAEFTVGNEDVDSGILEDVSDFVRFQEIIDGDDDCAVLQDAKEGGNEFRAVFQPQSDAVAG